MERKVGEIFTYEGKTYKVIQSNEICIGCAFKGNIPCKANKSITGECSQYCRSNNTSVVFKELNNMEIQNNQLTIDIPEGMEIDTEHSNLAKGIIKFKSKSPTYADIEDALNLGATRTGVTANVDNAVKLGAIDKLINIAKYYNGDWKPNWKRRDIKYYIYFDNNSNEYDINYNDAFCRSMVYFKNSKDVKAVIDNPNFRDILDTIYK